MNKGYASSTVAAATPRQRSAARPPTPGWSPPSGPPLTAAPTTSPAKKPYLDYKTALQQGWPIATGVIEGARRHLVKDRMDITGTRWGLQGAEAILKLRALVSNGDFDAYWAHHLAQEKQRIHTSRYLNGVPAA